MSEALVRVAMPWWLQQAVVRRKARAVVGAQVRAQGGKVTDGRQLAENEMWRVGGRHGRF